MMIATLMLCDVMLVLIEWTVILAAVLLGIAIAAAAIVILVVQVRYILTGRC